MAMTRDKFWFFLGLGLMISLVFYSVLKQHQPSFYELSGLVSIAIAALVFDYLKVSRFLVVLKEQEATQCPHDSAIQASLISTVRSPLILKAFKTELLSLHYAFFAKFETSGVATKHTSFSYARSSNARDVFLFVALSQLPFLPFIHAILEHHKGPGVAWVVTLLTLWSVIWYLAQVEAVKFRPIELSDKYLRYRFGLFWESDISLSNIKRARRIDVAETLDEDDLFQSPLGSAKNVMLEFEAPVRFRGPYRISKRNSKAAISMDNPERFLGQLALRGVATV